MHNIAIPFGGRVLGVPAGMRGGSGGHPYATYYASQEGAALNSNLTSGGGTDDSDSAPDAFAQ